MANKNLGCFVVNEKQELIIANGDILQFLSKEPKGENTHVLIGFYPHGGFSGEEEYTSKVFSLDFVYFKKREEWEK